MPMERMITATGISEICGRYAGSAEQSVIVVAGREDNYEHSTEKNRIVCDRSVKIVHEDNIFLCGVYTMLNHRMYNIICCCIFNIYNIF